MAARATIRSVEDVNKAIQPVYKEALAKDEVFEADGVTPKLNRWYSSVLNCDWNVSRKGNNGTNRWTVSCCVGGVWAPLTVKVFNEKHTGMIAPLLDEDVAKVNIAIKGKWQVKKRDKGVTLQVYRYSVQVPTEEDGITVRKGPDGKPMYPSDDKLSQYFLLTEVLDIFTKVEVGIRVKEGFLVTNSPAVAKMNKDGKLPKGAFIAPTLKIGDLVSRNLSMTNEKNAGAERADPVTRIRLDFDKDTQVAGFKFHDKNKPYTDANGRTQFELAKVDSKPVNGYNVHEFITSGSMFDGIVSMDNICSSNLAISMPVRASVVVMSKAVNRGADVDDLYGDMGGLNVTAGTPAASAAATPAAAAVAPLPPMASVPVASLSGAVSPDLGDGAGYDDLLADLGGKK